MKKEFVLTACLCYLILTTSSCSVLQDQNFMPDTTVKDYPAFAFDVKKDSSAEKFILFVDNPKNERLAIQIRFPDGGLYNDWISCPTFRQRYDLANLEDGIYTVTVSNYKKEISRSIQLWTKTAISRQILMN